MRRGFSIQLAPPSSGEVGFRDQVATAITAIEEILEGIDRDDCVTVLSRDEGRLYVATTDEGIRQISQLPGVTSLEEDAYEGYRVMLRDGAVQEKTRQEIEGLFADRGQKAALRYVERPTPRFLIAAGADEAVLEEAALLGNVSYVQPDYRDRGKDGPPGPTSFKAKWSLG